jgi:hypothetical protein
VRLPAQNALVDDADHDRVAAVRWREEHGLAVASGRRPRCTMHRFILGVPPGQTVYHRNRDTLDNRRENLLVCPGGTAKSLRRHALPGAGVRLVAFGAWMTLRVSGAGECLLRLLLQLPTSRRDRSLATDGEENGAAGQATRVLTRLRPPPDVAPRSIPDPRPGLQHAR